MKVNSLYISNSNGETPLSRERHEGDSECPICFISLQRALKEGRGLAIIPCCGSMMCNTCANVVKEEQNKGNLNYTCIFGVFCNGRN